MSDNFLSSDGNDGESGWMSSDLFDHLNESWGRWRKHHPGKSAGTPPRQESQLQNEALHSTEPTIARDQPYREIELKCAVWSIQRTDSGPLFSRKKVNINEARDFLFDTDSFDLEEQACTQSIAMSNEFFHDVLAIVAWDSSIASTNGISSPVVSEAGEAMFESVTIGTREVAPASSSSYVVSQWSNVFQVIDRLPGATVMGAAAAAAAASTTLHSSVKEADTVPPTVAILASTSSLKAGQTATIRFALSEASTNFNADSVSASGGVLSNFSGSGTSYTAIFTPDSNSTTAASVSVSSNKFSDAVGNRNIDGADANNLVNFSVDTVIPTVSVSSSTNNLKAGQTATVSFSLSEASTTFSINSLSVTGGGLSNFSGSGTSYSVIFTPNVNSSTAGSVSVGDAKFSDSAGNLNADGADSNNSVNFAVDTVVPAAPLARLDGNWTVNPQVTLQIKTGNEVLNNVVVEVFPNEVEATVANWLGYVNSGFYDGLIFHRVIPNFMAQAGGFTSDLIQKSPAYNPVALETNVHGLSNTVTTIAMARTDVPDSATSQFYFNLVDNPFLDYSSASPGYAVFGKVISGWSSIQTIGTVATSQQNLMSDVPINSVVLQKVSLTQTGEAYSSSGIIHLSGLEQGNQWSYSLDGGNVWTTFTQPDLDLGTVAGKKVVSFRQIDVAGNVSPTTSISFTQYIPDDLHSILDLSNSSDSTGGAAGTDYDNITQNNLLDLTTMLPEWANHEVWLMDQGRYVATATASGGGAVSWLNVPAAVGTHVYTLYDPSKHVRIISDGGVSVSELTVRVI